MSRGLFFPGMKCPDYCGGCIAFNIYWPEARYVDDEILCRAETVCMAAKKKIGMRTDRRPSWCPAREVEVEDEG